MILALFDRLGIVDRIVHFHFNTNFCGEPTHAQEHRKSTLQTAVLFGVIEYENGNDAYFDVAKSEKENTEAIAHLAAQISKAAHETYSLGVLEALALNRNRSHVYSTLTSGPCKNHYGPVCFAYRPQER